MSVAEPNGCCPRQTTIEDVLPDDCLVHIFKWLPLEHLAVSASRVCLRWEKVSRNTLLWQGMTFDLQKTRNNFFWRMGTGSPVTESSLQRRILTLASCLDVLNMDCGAIPGAWLAELLPLAPRDIRHIRVSGVVEETFDILLDWLVRTKDFVRTLTLSRRTEATLDIPSYSVRRFWEIVDQSQQLERLSVSVPALFRNSTFCTFGCFRRPRPLRSIVTVWFTGVDGGCHRSGPSEEQVWRDGQLSGTLAALIEANAADLEEVCVPWISDADQRAAVRSALTRCTRLRCLGVPCQGGVMPCLRTVAELRELRVYGTVLDTAYEMEAVAKAIGELSCIAARLDTVAATNLKTSHAELLVTALSALGGLRTLRLDACGTLRAAALSRINSLESLTLSRTVLLDTEGLPPKLKELHFRDAPPCDARSQWCSAGLAERLHQDYPGLRPTGLSNKCSCACQQAFLSTYEGGDIDSEYSYSSSLEDYDFPLFDDELSEDDIPW